MIAALAAVGMGILSAAGSIMQGDATSRIANINADMSLRNAGQARYAAREEAAQIRVRSAYVTGRQKATQGGTGIYVNSGTNADFRQATEDQFELDAVKALYTGELQATAFENEAMISRYTGRLAKRNSYFSAGFSAASSSIGAYNATAYAKTPIASNPSVMGGWGNPYLYNSFPGTTTPGRP